MGNGLNGLGRGVAGNRDAALTGCCTKRPGETSHAGAWDGGKASRSVGRRKSVQERGTEENVTSRAGAWDGGKSVQERGTEGKASRSVGRRKSVQERGTEENVTSRAGAWDGGKSVQERGTEGKASRSVGRRENLALTTDEPARAVKNGRRPVILLASSFVIWKAD